MGEDNQLTSEIAPYVMGYLERLSFFEKLDDILSPVNPTTQAKTCEGSYASSESILFAAGCKSSDFADVFAVLRSKGGCCDCEILYNVAESSRLKANYWRGKAKGHNSHDLPAHSSQ